MASNAHGQSDNFLNTLTTTTTTVSITRSPQTRPVARNDNVSTRDFSPPPVRSNNQTGEPFPTLTLDPPTRTLSRQRTNESDNGAESSTVHLTPARTRTTQNLRRRPIGIKRISSTDLRHVDGGSLTGRQKASSGSQRPGDVGTELSSLNCDEPNLQRTLTASSILPPLVEGVATRVGTQVDEPAQIEGTRPARSGSNRLRRASDAARSAVTRLSTHGDDPVHPRHDEYEYDHDVVDLLDVLDPEVSALTTLTNVQNSLFIPDLGRWLNRRPTYELSRAPTRTYDLSRAPSRSQRDAVTGKALPPTPTGAPEPPPKDGTEPNFKSDIEEDPSVRPRSKSNASIAPSIASVVQEEHFAVLPHGVSLKGWSEEEKELLDDYVRHMVHSKRSRFKRTMKAFGKYVSKPLGFFVTLYATLITLFGLAWVLFLIGWIYVGARQLYIINVIDNVLVALFAVMGDGLAPFRVVDTYHMCFIAHYHHLSWRLRKEKELPKLHDHNDLPEKTPAELDLEAARRAEELEFSLLTPEQQKKLQHHSDKFSKSHSFYKPHETSTHYAFPLRLLVAIVVLLDCHSLFQIALGACTWGISYHVRPAALTATILSFSITVNITAGILIKIGDKRTRKKDVLLRMNRQQLTTEAIKKVQKRKEDVADGNNKLDAELDEEWERKHVDVNGRKSSPYSSGSSEVVPHTK